MRIYYVYDNDGESGLAVAAHTLRQAKRMAFGTWPIECDWIEVRARWVREGDASGIEVPRILELKEGLERCAYAWIEEPCECGHPYCHDVINGVMMCDDCAVMKSQLPIPLLPL